MNRIIIHWPQGGTLPVRLANKSTGSDLIHLLSFVLRPSTEMRLLYHGKILTTESTLKDQGITEDCNIFVEILNTNPTQSDYSEKQSFEQSFESIHLESLRIADLRMQALDNCFRQEAIIAGFLSSSPECSDTELEITKLEIPKKANSIASDPLPVPWSTKRNTSETDDPIPLFAQFGTIKEANQFLSQPNSYGWL